MKSNDEQELIAGRFGVLWGAINDQTGKAHIAAGDKTADEVLWRKHWFVEGVVGTLPR